MSWWSLSVGLSLGFGTIVLDTAIGPASVAFEVRTIALSIGAANMSILGIGAVTITIVAVSGAFFDSALKVVPDLDSRVP
jgi:hypothetical protein